MNYKLEERTCIGGCGLKFKCLPSSMQKRAVSDELCQFCCGEKITKVEKLFEICFRKRKRRKKIDPNESLDDQSLESEENNMDLPRLNSYELEVFDEV